MKIATTAIVLSCLLALPSFVCGQVYGYTDENGVLILSNVPTEDRMRMIIDGTPEEAGKAWRYTGQYDGLIQKAAAMYHVDAALVRAVIAVESAFNRFARSHKGAMGLMQLMPSTARQLGVANPFDAWQNIRGGTSYLKSQLDDFGNLRLALAAYNAGPTAVRRYGTVPPYKETKNYVRKIMAIYRAGGKIEIVKAGKTYSIGAPGAKISVVGPGQTSGAKQSTLAALADRSRGRRTTVLPPAGVRPGPAQDRAPTPQPAINSVQFYRLTDPNGVIRITRKRPTQPPYEILEP